MLMTSLHTDDAPESVQPFMGVELSDLGRRMVLCRLPCPVATSRPVPEKEPVDASSWQRLATGSCGRTESLQRLLLRADIWRLRSLLAQEDPFVHRLNDYRVRSAVAQLVERGVLGLFERVDARGMEVAAAVPLPAATASEARPANATSSSAPARPARGPSPAPSASPAPARTTEAMEALDQEAQAAVLAAASRFGTPFCEECARRAIQREAGVAA